MDFDKKHLILVGIIVFALFIMGVGLAFKKDFKKMIIPAPAHRLSSSGLTFAN